MVGKSENLATFFMRQFCDAKLSGKKKKQKKKTKKKTSLQKSLYCNARNRS